MKRVNDEWIGRKVNEWKVIGVKSTEKGLAWICECKCGKVKEQKVWNVKSGKSRMCRECRVKENREKRKRGHLDGHKDDK